MGGRPARLNFEGKTYAKSSFGLMVKLKLFQILMESISDASQCDRLSVFDLLFGPELVMGSRVSTVGAMTGQVFAFESRAKLDLEVAFAIRIWALPTGKTVFGLNRD